MFHGWFDTAPACAHCGLVFERSPGYFLGSTYINYGITAVGLMALYGGLHFGVGWTNRELAIPLSLFCVGFPMYNFRRARALWLALDCRWDSTIYTTREGQG